MSVIRSLFNTLGFGKLQTPQGDDEKDFPEEAASIDGSLFTDFLEKDSAFNSSFGSGAGNGPSVDVDFGTNKTIKQQVKYEISLLEFPNVDLKPFLPANFLSNTIQIIGNTQKHIVRIYKGEQSCCRTETRILQRSFKYSKWNR